MTDLYYTTLLEQSILLHDDRRGPIHDLCL